MTTHPTQKIVAAALIAAVILGGLHGKEIAKLAGDSGDIKAHTDAQTKVIGELHNHIDKQTLHSLLKVSGGDTGNQVDNRSLRLLHTHRLISAHEIRHSLLGDNLLGLWLITAKVS